MFVLETWIAAAFVIMIYSHLIKDNVLFALAEHIYLGLSFGYAFIVALGNMINLGYDPLMKGNITILIPVMLGILLFPSIRVKYAWMSRTPLGLSIGVATGIAIRGTMDSQILTQVRATFLSPIGGTPLESLNNIIMIVFVITSLTYFIFTRKTEGPFGKVMTSLSTVGKWALMLSFGAGYGNTVMSRLASLIDICRMMVIDWLGKMFV